MSYHRMSPQSIVSCKLLVLLIDIHAEQSMLIDHCRPVDLVCSGVFRETQHVHPVSLSLQMRLSVVEQVYFAEKVDLR